MFSMLTLAEDYIVPEALLGAIFKDHSETAASAEGKPQLIQFIVSLEAAVVASLSPDTLKGCCGFLDP